MGRVSSNFGTVFWSCCSLPFEHKLFAFLPHVKCSHLLPSFPRCLIPLQPQAGCCHQNQVEVWVRLLGFGSSKTVSQAWFSTKDLWHAEISYCPLQTQYKMVGQVTAIDIPTQKMRKWEAHVSLAILKSKQAYVFSSFIRIPYCSLGIIIHGSWFCPLSCWFLSLNYPYISIIFRHVWSWVVFSTCFPPIGILGSKVLF